MTMKEASINSRRLVKRNLKNFIFEIIFYFVLAALAAALLTLCAAIPLLIVQLIPLGETAMIFCDILFTLIPIAVLLFTILMSVSFFVLKLTMLYKKYSSTDLLVHSFKYFRRTAANDRMIIYKYL